MGNLDAETAKMVFMAAVRDGRVWDDENDLLEHVGRLVYGRRYGGTDQGAREYAMKDQLWLVAEHWREEDLEVASKRRTPGDSIFLRRQTSFPLPVAGARSRRHTVDSVTRAEELRRQMADEQRKEEVERRCLHCCPCTRGEACQRRLTTRNSVPLPETDQEAHTWLRAIMQGPETLRYELLKHCRRLRWRMRVDVIHFNPAVIVTDQSGSVSATGPPTILVGSNDHASATTSKVARASHVGNRSTSEEKRAKGHVRRLAPSLTAEQLETFAKVHVSHTAIQDQHAALRAEHDTMLSRVAQLELALTGREEDFGVLEATAAAERERHLQAEVRQQAALAQALARAERAEAALAARRAAAELSSAAEQRWQKAMSSVKICLTWTGLLGPQRLESLANLVKDVGERILLDLPQVREAIEKLSSQRAAAGWDDDVGSAAGERDDGWLEEEDDVDDDDADVDGEMGNPLQDAANTSEPIGTDTETIGDEPMDETADEATDEDSAHPHLNTFPMRWAECYARVRGAGERTLTFRTRVLLTLVFLRLVHNADIVAAFFGVSRTVCVRVYRRTLCELVAVSRYHSNWPTWTRLVQLTSPEEQGTYGIGPDAAVLYGDCTGMKCYRPRSLAIARSLYSPYYGTCCFKYLVVVAPNGYVCVLSIRVLLRHVACSPGFG